MYYNARKGGSYIVDKQYFDSTNDDYSLDDIFEYLNVCIYDGACTFSELSSLCYDITCIYNDTATYYYKTKMYQPCDELKEMMYSRSFQFFKKYLDYKKKK